MEGPIKSPLSVRPSISSAFSSEMAQLFFSDFWHNGRELEYLKTDRALFSKKKFSCPNLGKKCQK